MARPTRDDNNLYGAVLDMLAALELESPAKAIEIGKKALRPRQDRTLDAIATKHDDLPARGGGRPALTEERVRKRERERRQLFELTYPKGMLAPANVVAVFLRDQPMWGSWSWSATQAVNTLMLSVASQITGIEPPTDPRLALPFTVAGLALYRAFHFGPARRRLDFDKIPALWLEVYREVAQGIVILDACLLEAARLKVAGDVPESFLDSFCESVDDAETLLLHAIRLGPRLWNLILECPLGVACQERTPYYVVARPSKADWHLRCRVAKTRASKARKDVTVTRRHKKITR